MEGLRLPPRDLRVSLHNALNRRLRIIVNNRQSRTSASKIKGCGSQKYQLIRTSGRRYYPIEPKCGHGFAPVKNRR